MQKFKLITVADAIVTQTYHVEAESEEAAMQLLEDGDLPCTVHSDWQVCEFGNGEEVVSVEPYLPQS